MEKEMHIYMSEPKDVACCVSYNSVLRALNFLEPIIHTTQTHFCSNRVIYDYGYTLYIHSEDGKIVKIDKNGTDATNRELREGHNLEKMLLAGEFGTMWCDNGAW